MTSKTADRGGAGRFAGHTAPCIAAAAIALSSRSVITNSALLKRLWIRSLER